MGFFSDDDLGIRIMKLFNSHINCEYYIEKYDECLKYCESNMSQRVKLCECDMRVPIRSYKND